MNRWMMTSALALLTSAAFAQPKEAPKPPPEAKPAKPQPAQAKLALPHERYVLDNGLEVLLARDERLPLVAVDIWYHVGAADETPGRSGFAHLFEHMMFQGSAHVPDDVHIAMLEQIGATDLNGTTDFDRTNYFETVPSHHLETALWLESDRMGFLLDALSPAKLDNQREVVKNERRQRIETQPYGIADERLWQALFPAPHPYFGNVIGSMEDLEAATPEDVRAFFKTWYAPSNATLAIVGDFDPARARALVQKYFGPLPKVPEPPERKLAPVTLAKERVIDHEEPVASLPAVFISWHTPAAFAPGDAEADILSRILTEGEAGRLERRLVREKQLAQSVSASQQSLGAQSVFTVSITARPGVSPDALLREADAVLEEIRTKGVTAAEVQRAQNRIETGMVAGLQRVGGFGGKSDLMQIYNHFLGRPDGIGWDLERYRSVTPRKVQAFAREHLPADRRVVVRAVPPGKSVSATTAPGTKEVR